MTTSAWNICSGCGQVKPQKFGPNYSRAVWVPAKRASVQTGERRPKTVADTEASK